jgi:hypothetical protein
MKIFELIENMSREDFDMVTELQVKKYLPIEEKKLIAQGIMYECIEEVDGALKIDSVQQHLSYVKYMILRHTNLEYAQDDYDALCEHGLLDKIIECFGEDAAECSRILNLMVDDRMREVSIESTVAKFLSNLTNELGGLSEQLSQKIENMDFSSVIPKGVDANKLANFFNTYVK